MRQGCTPYNYRHAHKRIPKLLTKSAAIVIIAAFLTTACAPIQPIPDAGTRQDTLTVPIGKNAVVEGGELVMALSAEPDKLDPTTSSSLYTRYVMNSICEKLYDLDESGNIVPQLADALPTISADGKTVTIPIRSGIKFADGTTLDADAVRTTLERNRTLEGSARKSELGPIDKIEASDKTHVTVTYSMPFAPLTAALADRAGMIMSPTALETEKVFSEHPVCVGAFKFDKRVPQTSITVVRDPNYYAADEVHLDKIVYRIMADANIRAANLRSGDVQVADTISPQDADSLLLEKGIGLLQSSSLGYQGITINVGNVNGVGKEVGERDELIAKDPRVRMALALSIDRKALVNSVFNNWYEPACSAISPKSPFSTPASEECIPFDPKRARDLLTDAGVTGLLPLTLTVSNSPDQLRFAQALQASVREGGFDLKIEPVEYSTLLSMQNQGDFDAVQLGWSGRIDPHGNLSTFLSTGGGNNVAGDSNPELDSLLKKASAETDVSVRAELYGQAVALEHQDNPIIYIYRSRNITGYSKKIVGVSTYTDGVVRLSRAAFLEEEN